MSKMMAFHSSKIGVNFTSGIMKELFWFGVKQLQCCVFPIFIFACLAFTHFVKFSFISSYDFMFIACVLMQMTMYFLKLETKDEVWVICLFHVIGLAMEIFKVHVGSWSYPGAGYLKCVEVPLYSGFMYASVACYMCQAWKRFQLKFTYWPNNQVAIAIAICVYLNFFTNHFMVDVRYVISIFIVFFFWKTKVHFTTLKVQRDMPVLVSFVLIAFFIFLAENLATFLGAWQYAHQHNGWQIVKWQKFSSWTFMVIISYILVAALKKVKYKEIA